MEWKIVKDKLIFFVDGKEWKPEEIKGCNSKESFEKRNSDYIFIMFKGGHGGIFASKEIKLLLRAFIGQGKFELFPYYQQLSKD